MLLGTYAEKPGFDENGIPLALESLFVTDWSDQQHPICGKPEVITLQYKPNMTSVWPGKVSQQFGGHLPDAGLPREITYLTKMLI